MYEYRLQAKWAAEVNWLTRHRDAYLGELSRLGYPTDTIGHYSRAIGLFCEQITERGLDAGDIDEAALVELQDAVPKLQSAKGQRGRQGCTRLRAADLDPRLRHGVPKMTLTAAQMQSLPEFFQSIDSPRRR